MSAPSFEVYTTTKNCEALVRPEFDDYSHSYETLLQDPMRDRFGGGGSGFFHLRKRDVILAYFSSRGRSPKSLSWLDVGCGRGDLLRVLSSDFARAAGCDPSPEMLHYTSGIDVRVQEDLTRLPYDDGTFDFVSAVCVLHHVPLPFRKGLVAEMSRVAKPQGTIAIIEHNPMNPITRAIVSRTPVDADAILLGHRETRSLLTSARLLNPEVSHFLFLPRVLFALLSPLENWCRALPFGGQYAAFATKSGVRVISRATTAPAAVDSRLEQCFPVRRPVVE